MRLIWRSCQGRQRGSNSDALAVGRKAGLLVCVLVDAAERSADSQHFARYWGERVVTQLLAEPDPHGFDAVVSMLRREQAPLRERFLMETASYCLLYLETETGIARIFHIGDCLAGQVEAGDVSWWVSPHTLDQEIPGANECDRHLLTRCLNARRFAEPEITTKQVPEATPLVLATDGYWAESLREGVPFGETQDDASYLIVEAGSPGFTNHSDTNNTFITDGHSQ